MVDSLAREAAVPVQLDVTLDCPSLNDLFALIIIIMSQHNYERKKKTDDDEDELDPVEEMVKKTGECGSDRGQFQASNTLIQMTQSHRFPVCHRF